MLALLATNSDAADGEIAMAPEFMAAGTVAGESGESVPSAPTENRATLPVVSETNT